MTIVDNHKVQRNALTAAILLLSVLPAMLNGNTANESIESKSTGGLASLRGLDNLNFTKPADVFKNTAKDRSPYISAYVYQPPLIPHQIRHYELSINANKCLSCHSFKNSQESGATKISVTHYATREGQVLSDVSPRRYFCLQCHVPQVDASPPINNLFQPVDSLR